MSKSLRSTGMKIAGVLIAIDSRPYFASLLLEQQFFLDYPAKEADNDFTECKLKASERSALFNGVQDGDHNLAVHLTLRDGAPLPVPVLGSSPCPFKPDNQRGSWITRGTMKVPSSADHLVEARL
jgi:hypothetical protein